METWSPAPEASWAAMGQLAAVSQDTERLKRTQGDGARAALSQQLAGRDPGCMGEMTRTCLTMPGMDSRCLRWSMTKWHMTGGISFQGSHLSLTQARLAWEGSAGHSTPRAPHPLANGSTPCCRGARFSPAGSQPRDFSQEPWLVLQLTSPTCAPQRLAPGDSEDGCRDWGDSMASTGRPGHPRGGSPGPASRFNEARGEAASLPLVFKLCRLPRQL